MKKSCRSLSAAFRSPLSKWGSTPTGELALLRKQKRCARRLRVRGVCVPEPAASEARGAEARSRSAASATAGQRSHPERSYSGTSGRTRHPTRTRASRSEPGRDSDRVLSPRGLSGDRSLPRRDFPTGGRAETMGASSSHVCSR